MLRNLIRHLTAPTPQSEPLASATTPQVANSAGGFAWKLSRWDRLERFLILGSEGGSYYASARALTLDNADSLVACLDEDGPRAVRTIARISQAGRAPRNDTAIFALAVALKMGDEAARKAAAGAVPLVCRTGSHLMAFASAVDALGGWGRATRRAFADWYRRDDVGAVAWQAMKYGSRHGWTHRDLLRKTHPVPPTAAHQSLYKWICTGELDLDDPRLSMLVSAKAASVAPDARTVARLIEAEGLPRECVPTQFLQDRDVWNALLHAGHGMPMTALLRNLGKMTSIGLLKGGNQATHTVVRRLRDRTALQRARVHPLQVLVALRTYSAGKGVRGSLTWRPVDDICRALDEAFELSFQSLRPSGARTLLAIDVSGSMQWGLCAGMTGISPHVGSAAMAMATARTEESVTIQAFSHKLVDAGVSRRHSLTKVLARFGRIPMGGTDCALPMLQAEKDRRPVDTFVVYTDSETWFGRVHPAVALQRYRDTMGIPARLVVVGMVSNGFSIANPDDAGMLDVVGFDSAAPRIISEFSRPLGRAQA